MVFSNMFVMRYASATNEIGPCEIDFVFSVNARMHASCDAFVYFILSLAHLHISFLYFSLFLPKAYFPAAIYLLRGNNRNTRARFEICSELTIKTPKGRQ